MGNFDKNVQGAQLEARRKAWEARQRSKEERQHLKHEERKERRVAAEQRLLRSIAAGLEAAEEQAYSRLFASLAGGGSSVSATSPWLVQFVVEHSSLGRSVPAVAGALRGVKHGTQEVDFETLLQLLRDHAVSEKNCQTSFEEGARGRLSITLDEAKTYAVHMVLKITGTEFQKEKWDGLAAAVFGSDLDAHFDQHRYSACCNKLARCARVLELEESRLLSEVVDGAQGSDGNLPWRRSRGQELEQWAAVAQDVRRWMQHLDSLAEANSATLPSSFVSALVRPSRRQRSEQSGLPAVASRCSLCLACGGLCSHHGGRPRIDSQTSPAGPKLAVSAHALANSRQSGAASPGQLRRPGPRCDLCKASGGRCKFHSRADDVASTTSATLDEVEGHLASERAGTLSNGEQGKRAVAREVHAPPIQTLHTSHDLLRYALAEAIESQSTRALEVALVAAAKCGLQESELMPVFEVLEDLWT